MNGQTNKNSLVDIQDKLMLEKGQITFSMNLYAICFFIQILKSFPQFSLTTGFFEGKTHYISGMQVLVRS